MVLKIWQGVEFAKIFLCIPCKINFLVSRLFFFNISFIMYLFLSMIKSGVVMGAEHKLKSLNVLESEIDSRIKEFNAKRNYNQRRGEMYSIGQFVLGGLTTLLIAINTSFSFFLVSILAIITSGLASMAGQVLTKYMYQEKMTMNIATVCDLYELKHLITMDKNMEEDDATRKITLERVQEYQDKYQNILNAANNKWQEIFVKGKSKE
ncbi:TPA: SLATT domain-containing protein [Klebsiella pneumoniae]|nr:SLATT domain-containing protein [Klebsiella pneumoniae]